MGPDHLMQGRYIDIIIISLVVSFFFCCVLILYLQEGDNIFSTIGQNIVPLNFMILKWGDIIRQSHLLQLGGDGNQQKDNNQDFFSLVVL